MTKIVKKISDKGYPVHNKHYESAHEEADKAEKKRFPKGYQVLKKAVRHAGKHELLATNKKSGKIEVEAKFKKYKKELAFHERKEHKSLTKMNKK